MLDVAAENLTTSFTEAQRAEVNDVLEPLVTHCLEEINRQQGRITEMDKRPQQVWSEQQPDVFFQYVAQGMLEDLIAMLKAHV